MFQLKKFINSRKLRLLLFVFIILTFLFLITINYSLYVKTKAYEIFIKFDKYSLSNSNEHAFISNNNNDDELKVERNSYIKLYRQRDTTTVTTSTTTTKKAIISTTINTTAIQTQISTVQIGGNRVVNYESGNITDAIDYVKVNKSSNLCPIIPTNLKTRIPVNETSIEINEIENLFQNFSINFGGIWSPKDCQARYRVAIVIPYRNREENLKLFLRHMHPFLRKQQLDYGIFIVEPIANITFNRGLLMNIGFIESQKLVKYMNTINETESQSNNTKHYWQCFVFHDVDLLPEDERNIYSCPEQPRHMSSAVSTFNYKLPYSGIFGGVTELTKEQYESINGFSNIYFGWGGEDDDLRNRIVHRGYKIARYPLEVGRYKMAKHEKDKPNAKRHKYLSEGTKRIDIDGLTSLKYDVIKIEKTLLYTKIYVNYNEKEILKQKY